MPPRILTLLDLLDIVVSQLIVPDQVTGCGHLSEFRLHRHILPLYPAKRDKDRRATRAMPAQWATLSIASLALLPIGRTWKSIVKRFCCITYDLMISIRMDVIAPTRWMSHCFFIFCVSVIAPLFVIFVPRHFNL